MKILVEYFIRRKEMKKSLMIKKNVNPSINNINFITEIVRFNLNNKRIVNQ